MKEMKQFNRPFNFRCAANENAIICLMMSEQQKHKNIQQKPKKKENIICGFITAGECISIICA